MLPKKRCKWMETKKRKQILYQMSGNRYVFSFYRTTQWRDTLFLRITKLDYAIDVLSYSCWAIENVWVWFDMKLQLTLINTEFLSLQLIQNMLKSARITKFEGRIHKTHCFNFTSEPKMCWNSSNFFKKSDLMMRKILKGRFRKCTCSSYFVKLWMLYDR